MRHTDAWRSFQQELLGITIHLNFCNSTHATVSKQSKQRQHVRFYYTIDLPCLCISCSIICTVCHVTYILKAVYSKLGHNLATELPQWVEMLTAIHLSHEHDKNNDLDTFSSKLRTCWSECACLSMNIWPDKFLKRTCNNGHTIKGSIYWPHFPSTPFLSARTTPIAMPCVLLLSYFFLFTHSTYVTL